MATRVIDDTKLNDIAVAIQAKDSGGQMTVDEMPIRIANIPSGGGTLITKTITQNGVYNASSDNADGYDVVTVDVDNFDMAVTDNQIKMLVYIDDFVASCYVMYIQTIANDVEVDWGDGSPLETSNKTGTDRYTCAVLSHTYTKRGHIIITFTANDGILKTIGQNGFLTFAGANGSVNGNQYPNNNFRNNVIGLSYGNNTMTNGAVDRCYGLLFALNIDSGVTNSNTLYITFRNGITSFPTLSTTLIRNVIISELINVFPNNALRNCPNLNIVDFTNLTIENLNSCTFGSDVFASSGSLGNSLSHPILLFATQEIAEAAKQKTNLAVYAAWITYEGAS